MVLTLHGTKNAIRAREVNQKIRLRQCICLHIDRKFKRNVFFLESMNNACAGIVE